jgi:glucose/arabinose dehydrogenase
MFTPRYLRQLLIAEHGSWNRSAPTGYRITAIVFERQLPVRYQIFAEGWFQGDRAWGQPGDVLVLKYGSLLVSDDRAGARYRITYDRSS